MALTGNESEQITLEEATTWISTFRQEFPSHVKAHFFGKNKIQDLLDQEDCVGLRAYYAIDDDDKKQLVLVGVDEDGNDLYNGILLERSIPCPNMCAASSPFN